MAILTTSNLSQSFGAADIFRNISVSLPNDGKVGLVGPNGVGKTSLLLILAKLTEPYTGTVHRARGTRIGYLPQEATQAFAGQEHTIMEEMLTVFNELRQEEEYLRQMEAQMAEGAFSEAFLEKYGAAQQRFELAGGYDYEVRIKQVLQGLDFGAEKWSLPLHHLSGGQKTRVLLGRLLLEQPDLLILDEPTNHLDVAAIEWLESVLTVWDGALLIVSHDRYFLDAVVNMIWEMRPDGIESYRGNYSAYVQQRQERWQLRQQEFDTLKERLEKELDYIRRNIAGQRTQMAKGKLSRISRELEALHKGGLDALSGKSWAQVSNELEISRHAMSVAEAAQAIKTLERPSGAPPVFNVRLQTAQRSGQIVLRTEELTVGYPGTPLFEAEDIELHRLECAALIGPNGTGKTTFLRTIQEKIEPLAGEIRLGASLDIGYFAQAHEQLNSDNQVIEELMEHHHLLISESRQHLARYLFQGDDVYKQVSDLSGGERGRLAMAILALEDANFLLLDEPTNHLDIPAQEMLQSVLEQFQGTILLVSHDRYLVDRLATQIWHLENGRLTIFQGTYQEFLAEREAQAAQAQARAKEETQATRQNTEPEERPTTLSKNEARRRAQRLHKLEQEINELEMNLLALGEQLQTATAEEAFDKIQNLSIEYTTVEKQIESLMNQWENLASE